MDAFVGVIIYLGVFIVIMSSVAKKKKRAAKNSAQKKTNPGVQNTVAARTGTAQPVRTAPEKTVKEALQEGFEAYNAVSPAGRAKAAAEAVRRAEQKPQVRQTYSRKPSAAARSRFRELEDDSNDWLARQMNEERKAYREMSEMFEAKLSHMSNCAAENLRLDHTLHCDAKEVARVSRK